MELKFKSFKEEFPEFNKDIIVRISNNNCFQTIEYRIYSTRHYVEGLWIEKNVDKLNEHHSLSCYFYVWSNERFKLSKSECEWAYLEDK